MQGISRTRLEWALFSVKNNCRWEPPEIGTWLGLTINTMEFELCIPEDKIHKLHGMPDKSQATFAPFIVGYEFLSI